MINSAPAKNDSAWPDVVAQTFPSAVSPTFLSAGGLPLRSSHFGLRTSGLVLFLCIMFASSMAPSADTIHLLTLDPGHFHAGLVQKLMYPQVSPEVHVYAPAG